MEREYYNKVIFENQCIVDSGKVFYYKDRVFREIYSKQEIDLYRRILKNGLLLDVFNAGLINTWFSNDISLRDDSLIIEHEKIYFFLQPCEMTDLMFWDTAKCFINISKELLPLNLRLKDSHPWNFSFQKGKPVFFDFCSITEGVNYTESWFEEFFTHFIVPIFLASSKIPELAIEYRREHHQGLGVTLSKNIEFRKKYFKKFFNAEKYLNIPAKLLSIIDDWLQAHQPGRIAGKWNDYDQDHQSDFKSPATLKQKFVYKILQLAKPKTVVDLAANKGYYSFMAAHLNSHVIGIDYEPQCIDTAIKGIKGKTVDFCQMNFLTPTPAHGWGLLLPDAFKRFNSEIGIALGLIHHICLTQRFPVKLFCETCAKFAERGVILEYVYPEDVHVKNWKIQIPDDYNVDSIKQYFGKYYSQIINSELYDEDGVKRQFFFFSK